MTREWVGLGLVSAFAMSATIIVIGTLAVFAPPVRSTLADIPPGIVVGLVAALGVAALSLAIMEAA